MTQTCLRCGLDFEAQRPAKWCGSTCRARAHEEGLTSRDIRSQALSPAFPWHRYGEIGR